MTNTNNNETQVRHVFLTAKGKESGAGVKAFVHTTWRGLKISAKVGISKNSGKLYAMPGSNEFKGKYYPHFEFADRVDSDAWSETCIEAFEAKVSA